MNCKIYLFGYPATKRPQQQVIRSHASYCSKRSTALIKPQCRGSDQHGQQHHERSDIRHSHGPQSDLTSYRNHNLLAHSIIRSRAALHLDNLLRRFAHPTRLACRAAATRTVRYYLHTNKIRVDTLDATLMFDMFRSCH